MHFLLIARERLLAGVCAILLQLVVLAAPANDAYANRISLNGTSMQLNVSLFGATFEAGETVTAVGEGSVWWSWVAVSNGIVDVSAILPLSISGALQVFHTPAAAPMPTDTQRIYWDGLFQPGSFPVIGGDTYVFRIYGSASQQQSAQIQMTLRLSPQNDHFVNRIALPADVAEFSGSVFGASREVAEGFDGGATVWWSWTPNISGYAAIFCFPENPDAGPFDLVIWKGDSLDVIPTGTNLVVYSTLRAESSVYFPITAAQPYLIRLSGDPRTNVTQRFTVTTIAGPGLLSQPKDQTIRPGGATFFHVYAPGIANTNVTWQFNGSDIQDAYGETYPIFNAVPTDAGKYRAVVKNGGNTTLSREATLTVAGGGPMLMRISRDPSVSVSRFDPQTLLIGMEGEFGMYHTLQRSDELEFWRPMAWNETQPSGWLVSVPATMSAPVRFSYTPGFNPGIFFRAVRVGFAREACIVNLRRHQLAQEDFRIRNQIEFGANVNMDDVNKYFSPSLLPRCPIGGAYENYHIGYSPTCSLAIEGHTL